MILIIILCGFLAFAQCNAGDDQRTPTSGDKRKRESSSTTPSPVNSQCPKQPKRGRQGSRPEGRRIIRPRCLIPAIELAAGELSGQELEAEQKRQALETELKRQKLEAKLRKQIQEEAAQRIQQATAFGNILGQRRSMMTCGQELRLFNNQFRKR